MASSISRLAVAGVGDPRSPSTWSGIPVGVMSGLASYGVATAGIDATPPTPWRQAGLLASAAIRASRVDAWYTSGMRRLRDAVAAARLRSLDDPDAVLLLGAEFGLPRGTRYAVLVDMTLAQAREVHPVFSKLSAGTFARWKARHDRIYSQAEVLLAASHWTARSMVADHGANPARVHVVGFGCNHRPSRHVRDWTRPRLLFVGREWQRKNGPAVLRAFTQLQREHPTARLDLVGEHPPVQQTGVTTHGPLKLDDPADAARVAQLFREATCFVMPSACEPFGIAYAEAATAGIGSIATNVGGAATIVGNDAGILVDPGDDAALLTAMRRFAQADAAAAMGDAAAAGAERFTWSAVAGRVLRAFDAELAERRGAPGFL